jgi:hypothetical protein
MVDGVVVPPLPHEPLLEANMKRFDAIFGVTQSESVHMFNEAFGNA